MVNARASPDALDRWLALYDAALALMTVAPGRAALVPVGAALDALAAYEHTLSPAQRQAARERVWHRDKRDPLPIDREWWGWCQCRTCVVARRLAIPDRRETAWQAQARTLARQRERNTTKGTHTWSNKWARS
jgi:hypothetical protein